MNFNPAAVLWDMLAELGAKMVVPHLRSNRGFCWRAPASSMRRCWVKVDPVADVLNARQVPIVFATGHGRRASGPPASTQVIEKLYTLEELAAP